MQDEVLGESQKKGVKKRGVYILPNLVTSASLFGGFYSIIASIDGHYEAAAIAILISGILDGLDGRIARITGTTSKFGMEYDSLSDLVAFGLAPGILIFMWALKPFGKYGWLAAFIYVVCGALRLARFNVQISTVESRRFNGLPIPAAAALVAATVLLFHSLGQGGTTKHVVILVLVYLLGFFMVSNIKYYSFKDIGLARRMPFRFLVALILLFILIAAEPYIMIFVLAFGYALSGPVLTLVDMLRGAPASTPHGADKPQKKEERHLV